MASLAVGCHKLAPDSASVPTATLTGTAIAPLDQVQQLLPASAVMVMARSQAIKDVPVPLAHARVQALDVRLQPIAGIPEVQTDSGGHFALDVPAGRPYILRFSIGERARSVDVLAVARPDPNEGAAVVTADFAMNVAAKLLLERSAGSDAGLSALGGNDLQALVEGIRRRLATRSAHSSLADADRLAKEAETQADVSMVLSRVDRAAAESSSGSVATTSRVDDATADLHVDAGGTPSPAPIKQASVLVSPTPAPAPAPAAKSRITLASNPPAETTNYAVVMAAARHRSTRIEIDPFDHVRQVAKVSIQQVPLAARSVRSARAAVFLMHRPLLASRHGNCGASAVGRPPEVGVARVTPGARIELWQLKSRTPVAKGQANQLSKAGASQESAWQKFLASLGRWLPRLRLPLWPHQAPGLGLATRYLLRVDKAAK